MHKFLLIPILFVTLCIGIFCEARGQSAAKSVLVLFENKGHHKAFTDRAIPWIQQLAKDSNLHLILVDDVSKFREKFLNQFQLIIQLDYVPYGWTDTAKNALRNYIEKGYGGWIGLHHAGLLGDFDGHTMWPWFSDFLGGIRYKNYIPGFAAATVINENNNHPVMKGLPDTFTIYKEEWYTWDRSPRSKTEILAAVDEKSYHPDSDIKMGDHPVVWTNVDVRSKNLYIFMGHGPELFDNPHFVRLFRNAICWTISNP